MCLPTYTCILAGFPDQLIALNHVDNKMKDKRFPKTTPEKPKPLYSGLDYRPYGVDTHHWPGEESDETRPPKPWMVPAIPLSSGPKVGGYSPQHHTKRENDPSTASGKESSRYHNGTSNGTEPGWQDGQELRVSVSMDDLLDEADELLALPRAQLKKADSSDNLTTKVPTLHVCLISVYIARVVNV